MNEHKSLLIIADDVGLHADIDKGVEMCIEQNKLSGISIIANAANTDWDMIKAFSSTNIYCGLHLTLLELPWLSGNVSITNWKQLVIRYILGGDNFVQRVRQEAETQIEKLLEQGIAVDHIDSHQHVHMLPGIWKVVTKLQEKYNIDRIRIPIAASKRSLKGFPFGMILDQLSSLRTVDQIHACIGLRDAGRNKLNGICAELQASRFKRVEFVAHPGSNSSELNHVFRKWNYDWSGERDLILSSAWADHLNEHEWKIERKDILRSGDQEVK